MRVEMADKVFRISPACLCEALRAGFMGRSPGRHRVVALQGPCLASHGRFTQASCSSGLHRMTGMALEWTDVISVLGGPVRRPNGSSVVWASRTLRMDGLSLTSIPASMMGISSISLNQKYTGMAMPGAKISIVLAASERSLACMANARRKLSDIHRSQGSAIEYIAIIDKTFCLPANVPARVHYDDGDGILFDQIAGIHGGVGLHADTVAGLGRVS